jgi:hypothetical protein
MMRRVFSPSPQQIPSRTCRKRTFYLNFGNQALYLRKGEKGLLPKSTTDHQGEVAEKNLLTQLWLSSFLPEKG